jgi:ATP-dependent RNA helicase DDX10/DBP4
VAMLGAGSDDDDGYVSPDFELPPAPAPERAPVRSAKRHKADAPAPAGLADDEALALKLLRGG